MTVIRFAALGYLFLTPLLWWWRQYLPGGRIEKWDAESRQHRER